MDDLSREHLISDAMRSEELQNAFMRTHAEALDDGLFKRQGRDALDGAAEAEERLRKAREELLGQAGNERQRSMLGEDLNAHLTVARDDIARHVARQTLQWERSVRQQRLDLLHAKARRDFADPARLAVYADAAATAGENAEAARSALYRIAIGEALTRGQHKAARDLVDRAQPHLGEQDRADLEAELGIAGQLQRGNDYLATLLPNLLPATATDTDAAHETAWRKNLIDWAHDPDQQATNRHLIDVRFGRHHRGLQKARVELEKSVQAWMGETDADGDPQTNRPPPSIWKQLDADQRRDIDATLARNARGGELSRDIRLSERANEGEVEPPTANDNAKDLLPPWLAELPYASEGDDLQNNFHRVQVGNPVTPRGFTYEYAPPELDPHKLNRRIPQAEQQQIANVLGKMTQKDFTGLRIHEFQNRPHHVTGARLPPSAKGYVAVDVPDPDGRMGDARLVIDRGTVAIYYTRNHYYSFYPVRLNPPK